MKPTTRQLFVSVVIACFFTLVLATFAQEPAPATPPPPPEAEKPVPAPASAADQPPAAPAEAVATTPAPPAETVTPVVPDGPSQPEATPKNAPKLRRLDGPPATEKRGRKNRPLIHHSSANEIVNIGSNSYLPKGQTAEAVVAIFGNATNDGAVSDSVVSILGNTRANAPVGEAVVAVGGNTYVNSKVGDAVVAVFGSIELGPEAEVDGEIVAVGGTLKRDPKAIVHGQIQSVALGGFLQDIEWLRTWILECALYGRLLAFGPNLMWAWWIAIGFLLLYVVLAALFGKGVDKCCDTFEQRPGYSILTALLTVLLAPVVAIILILTGVGIAVLPFLGAGLFFAGLFGKAVMFAWLGRRILGFAGVKHPVLAVVVGGVIVLFLYTVPVLGLVLYKLLGWVGLGVVVYTLALGMKREKPAVPPTVPPSTPGGIGAAYDGTATLAPAVMPPGVMPVVSAATLPRAGFWIRMAALLLDVILVGIVMTLFRSPGKFEVVALAAYGACMWKLRGTTIGGIVCGLKVVRLDDRPIDWSTAIVRALGCFLSLVVLGLGFIWVAFDDQKQSWHDKIAGTTVVRVPKGVSLI